MQTILRILMEAGPLKPGFHIHIDNLPWMPLDIEDIQQNGPHGLPSISVAHYGEQNGDLMRDPEMLFEMRWNAGTLELDAYYWRNDYLGIEEYSSLRDNEVLKRQHESFARIWDRNLHAQGFLEAFRNQLNRG